MTTITNTTELQAACAHLQGSAFITVDTEFQRESTYWPVLCLIQVAGEDYHCAIDPLAPGLDLAPFYALMRDKTVLKVFHSARQDIEIFVHEMGDVPHPLFDTQIAAMVCGFGESVGYETLVSRLTGARLDKSVRFTDWSRRPLSPRQIDYAISDVTHLRTIYEKFHAMLAKSNRESWLDEEMAVLTNPATYRADPKEVWKRLKPRSKNARFLAVVQALAAWREEEAQRRNVPRNRIVRDDVLLEIAAHPPTELEALGDIRGFSKSFAKGREGLALMTAVQEAMALPPADLPTVDGDGDARLQTGSPLADLLKVLLKLKCQRHDVASKLVASSQDLDLIAAYGPKADVAALKGWRHELFGADALALRDGTMGLAVRRGRLVLFDIAADGTAVTRGRSSPGGQKAAPVPPAVA